MRLKLLLSIIFIAFFSTGFSQDIRAFAITGQANGSSNWADIRTIDMSSGNVTGVLYEAGKTEFSFKDAETNQAVNQISLKGIQGSILVNGKSAINSINVKNPSPTLLMSAAIAYDKKHSKLFFASMHTGNLVWLDLSTGTETPAFYTIEKPLVSNDNFNDEAFNITRMTIGADGNGYALTNDANHLISFTTGNKTVITDLGNLEDEETNQGISVHNQCSSWGGDVVSDAFGNLYLFAANHSVFEIDIPSRIATYKGSVLNLPPTFSINGAAVIDDDNVIVSSANSLGGFYKVNMNDFSATKLNTQGQIFNVSDLASSNLLKQGIADAETTKPDVIGNKFISIYPNPVTNGQMKISFDNDVPGTYEVVLSDLQGRYIQSQTVYIKFPGQVENFGLKTRLASGLYVIKVTDETEKIIFSDKLVISNQTNF